MAKIKNQQLYSNETYPHLYHPETRVMIRFSLPFLLITLVDLLIMGQNPQPELKTISLNGNEFVETFNGAVKDTRLVLVFSPT